MSKMPTSIRLEAEIIKELDELIEYYQKEIEQQGLFIKLNKTNVIERLIREKYNELKKKELM